MTNNEAAKWIQLYIDLAKIDPTTGEAAYLNDDARKTIEAMEMAINALTAQPDFQQTCNKLATDCISRRAAISLPVKPKEDRYFQTQNLDDAYDYGWYSLQSCIERLPSVQPDLSSYSDKLWHNAYERGRAEAQAEIIRCKNCKWFYEGKWCVRYMYGLLPEDFCSYAERRTDETD